MASETGSPELSSFSQSFINSRNSDISLFFPFILGLTTSSPLQDSPNTPQETENQASPRELTDTIILINPFPQGMFLMETSNDSPSLGFNSLFGNLFSGKNDQRPASKASIDAMPSVEIEKGEKDDEQCVVCLEEWENGEKAQEMPCGHRFHGDCIEKWLKIRASCPVCRYEMPVDEDGEAGNKNGGESDGGRSGVLVSFTFGGDRRSRENSSIQSDENSDSSSNHQETEG
ncbi:Ubiquitin--protein ligase [Handroanthus impetiginosus]|uniref:RING-type E3 ubiquitin transferase n=1 Tax=Handroanthus impetiginosus TaxID=429701 RepID=A0A2G9I2T1_9LAMI|nr:Ubiquitin--protein ligase [Handroanthus impetiginosus]